MTKLRLRPLLLVSIVVSVVVACIARRQLERTYIAFSIYRAHIITPPAVDPAESALHRVGQSVHFYWDFAGIPMARAKRLKQLNPTLQPLVREMSKRVADGEDMQIPLHIYREIRWRLNFTPDLAATQAKINALQQSLATSMPGRPLAGDQQDTDGSWARGIDVWYLKLYYSVDKLQSCQGPSTHPLTFLDRINSPNELTTVLKADLHDDFTRTGIFNREETDETFSALARMLFESHPITCYQFNPGLQMALRKFVSDWQNPATGYWGQWLVDRDGKVWKMDDMAMTFHVVSDLHGEVDHLDQIAKRTLQLDRVNFPAGVRFDGHYENHLNWDVVKIFRLAWPTLDLATRAQARAEIRRMLDWCLHDSYQPDGSFKISDLDDTSGDAYEYGVNFLVESGYFDPRERFWTEEKFPDAEDVRRRVESKLTQIGFSDPKIRGVYEVLEKSTPADKE